MWFLVTGSLLLLLIIAVALLGAMHGYYGDIEHEYWERKKHQWEYERRGWNEEG